MMSRSVALFAECQFTHFRPEVESHGVKLKMDVDTHHILGGLSFRF